MVDSACMPTKVASINLSCPTCGTPFGPEDVNVATDVAYCRSCNKAQSLSALLGGSDGGPNRKPIRFGASFGTSWATGGNGLRTGAIPPTEAEVQLLESQLNRVDIANPPEGAWYRDDGMELTIGASHRSVGGAVGTLLMSLFWNGIVSVFVCFAIAGTIAQLGFKAPSWFPAPVMNGKAMSLGMVIFLWLFLTPFILIGLAMLSAFVMSVAGRVEVTVRDAEGTLFSGVGRFGRRQKFDASSIAFVAIQSDRWRDNDGDRHQRTRIVLDTSANALASPNSSGTIRFGSGLPEARRTFVAGALRKALVAE